MEDLRPENVLDIGANTGEYSALAATMGASVVALERDAAAAERLYCMTSEGKLPVETIYADLARPTPAVGWDNHESLGLIERLEGQFDVVMMLALIHHLVLMEQIPLEAIAVLCERLTRRYLIVEWVPVEDPMYQSLMRGRVELYGSLSAEDLMRAFVGRFEVLRQQRLGNGRILFLFAKRVGAL
jgi:SAM-dependent methyltransferase